MSDQRFAVSRVAIVGRDLEYVEYVLGRQNGVLRWPTALHLLTSANRRE
jgi:hypothetical protein